jgi:ubiquinone/menaquinone biosynthesis C-methylase UbiE
VEKIENLQAKTIESYNRTAAEFNDTIATLNNYDHTYQFICNRLHDGDAVLDLACGPGQISKYLRKRKNLKIVGVDLSEEMLKIARREIPDGIFHRHSIVTYCEAESFNLVLLGFALPYLTEGQMNECIFNSSKCLKKHGIYYLSFMEGDGNQLEKTSFGQEYDFLIFYHPKARVISELERNGIELLRQYCLDYHEPDGRITKDIVFIGEKNPNE